MASNGGVGRLWVAVDANITPAMNALKALDAQAMKTAHHLNAMGSGSGGAQGGVRGMANELKTANKAADATAQSVKKIGLHAQAATSPMKGLQASAYRMSQAFINLRYGNPIGMIAGVSQSASSAKSSFAGLASEMGMTTKAAGPMGAAVAAAVAALGAVYVTAGLIGKSGLESAADLEMLRIQYEGLLGSAARASSEVDYLLQLGTQSVVPTEGLFEANRLLLAYGVTADTTRRQLVKFMSDFGSATGIPAARLQDMAYALGQIQAQGKANQIDMRQLANAGLNLEMVYGKVAKQQGISVEKAKQMTSEGKMTAAILIPAITALGGKYADAAQKARDSAQGILANIKDIAKIKMGLAFETLLKTLKPALKWVQDFIQAFDFTSVAQGFQSLVDSVSAAFGGITLGAKDAGGSIGKFIGEALVTLGANLNNIIKIIRTVTETIHQFGRGVYQMGQNIIIAFAKSMGFLNDMMDWLGAVSDETGQKSRDYFSEIERNAQVASDNANAEIDSAAQRIAEIWSQPVYKPLSYYVTTTYTGEYGAGQHSKEYYKDYMKRLKEVNSTPDTLPTTSSGSKTDKEKQRWQTWLSEIRTVIDDTKDAWKELRGLTSRFTAGEMSKIEEAFRFGGADGNFQGDVTGIIGMYDQMTEQIRKFYSLYTKYGSKASRAAAIAERDQMIKGLKKQAVELVRLARENEAYAKQLSDWQRDEGIRVQGQIDALNNSYNGYNDARGYAVKGAIENAQDLLDKATQAYEDANAKLQDLIAARDDFLNGIRDSAREFVNALETSSETIATYTRLDSAGSFLMEEKQKTASLKDQMAARLEVLKTWSANIKTLIARGLNGTLLQDLVSAGPEAAGAAVQQLVDGAQTGIDEVNAIQNELSTVVAGLQTTASSQWFDSGIATQQQSVNALAAAKAAAETALTDTQAAYNRQLAQLQAYQASVEAGTDANSKRLTALMQQNDDKAAEIAASIQKKFEWLTDRENNDKNLYDLGVAAIDGLIQGLEAKEDLVVATAKRIAGKVSKTIADALKIQSPSKVMEGYGNYIGEGLAIGMESSLSKVETAALVLSGGTMPSMTPSTSGFQPSVQVFIGDRELTDLVDMRIKVSDGQSLDYVSAGRRI